MSTLRRWFGLRCKLHCCPCEADNSRPFPGPFRWRCVSCGKTFQ